jgi:hypothetical protein
MSAIDHMALNAAIDAPFHSATAMAILQVTTLAKASVCIAAASSR